MSNTTDGAPAETRKMSHEEAEALFLLVRGGWLKVELSLDNA